MPGQKEGKLLIPHALGEKNEDDTIITPTITTTPHLQRATIEPDDNNNNIVTVASASTEELNPSLAYIQLNVGLENNNNRVIHIRALHDSGCAVTTITSRTFLSIPGSNINLIKQPKVPIMIQSCTGELTPSKGVADIMMQFIGENGNIMWTEQRVVISDHIDYDLILGRDVTGSPLKIMETNDHIYFHYADSDVKITNPLEYATSHNQHVVNVKIHNRSVNSYEVVTQQDIVIAPWTMANITCAITSQSRPLPIKTSEGAVFYEIVAVNISGLRHMRNTMLAYTDSSALSIPVYNDTNDYLELPCHTQVAQIEHFDHSNPMYEMQINTLESGVVTLNSAMPLFIDNDEWMNEEEKMAAFLEFAEKGTFQPSMTHLIESAPSITELKLQETTQYTNFDDQFDLAHLPEKFRKKTLKILKKNQSAFSKHDQDIGKVNCIEMDIELDESKPRIQKYIPVPHACRAQLREVLDQFQEFGVIRECHEPSYFCSNLIVVPKKDKKQIRVIFDGRLLNNVTMKQPTVVVNSQEIKSFLTGKQWITTADISHAFYQIPLSARSQPFTAFYSEAHGMRYCFTRAPQGLKNSPLMLKLLMDKLFGNMADCVIHYADDLMIATNGTYQEHLDVIDKVLSIMSEANLKINPKKMNIAKNEIEFLGIIWKKGSLHIPEAKLSAFTNYPMPNTPKRTKSFVCAMSYYRQFIPRFAELSKPLMDIASLHQKQFHWEEKHTKIFKKMIKSIIEHSSLYLPKPDEPFFVQTDASNVCGAGRVFQKNEKDEEMLIACISRTFTRAERKYGAFKKEVLALLYTLRSLDFFLRYAPKLTILVDAKAIIFLRLCKDSSGILLRFSLELSSYHNAEIHHVAGTNNVISDILSRHHEGIDEILAEKKVRYLTEQQTEDILERLSIPNGKRFTNEEVAYMMEAESLLDPIPRKPKSSSSGKPGKRSFPNMPKTLHERKIKMPKESFRRPGLLLPTCSCTQLQEEECKHPTMNYDELKTVSKILVGGQIDTKTFIEMQKADPTIQKMYTRRNLPKIFSYQQNILMYGFKKKNPVLPIALLDLLIQSKHFTVFGMHNSISRMTRDIKKQYFTHTATLQQKLRELKTNCLVCQFNKTNVPSHTIQISNFKKAPQVCWAIDIIPNMPKTINDYSAILLAIDTFTGYVSLSPLKSRSTTDIMEALRNAILNPFQIPHLIRCDNETAMANSTEFATYLQDLNIKFEPTSTAAPWGNGAAERAIQTIKSGMRKFLMQENLHDCWDKYIPFITDAHNLSTSVYGFAPAELQFGNITPRSSDLIQMWPAATNVEEYIKLIVPIAEEARKKAFDASRAENERVLTYRNKNRATKTFKIGEVVLHKQLQLATGKNMGMKPKFTGPYVIVGLDKNAASAVIENLTTGRTMKAHFTNLQLFSYHPSFAKLPDNFEAQLWNEIPEKFSNGKYFPKSQFQKNGSETGTEEKSKLQFDSFKTDEEKEEDAQFEMEKAEPISPHIYEFDPQREKYFQVRTNKVNSCTNQNSNKSAASKIVEIEKKQMYPHPNEVQFEKILFEENFEGETKCISHPENCQCSIDKTEIYGYQNEHVHDSTKQPKKSNLKKWSKYGKFIVTNVLPSMVDQNGNIDQDVFGERKKNPFYTEDQIDTRPVEDIPRTYSLTATENQIDAKFRTDEENQAENEAENRTSNNDFQQRQDVTNAVRLSSTNSVQTSQLKVPHEGKHSLNNEKKARCGKKKLRKTNSNCQSDEVSTHTDSISSVCTLNYLKKTAFNYILDTSIYLTDSDRFYL